MKTPAMVSTIATINNSKIVVIENGEKRVAVKPICQALGIDYSRQLKKLKEDEILSSVVGAMPTTGTDGKTYEMVTIPFKFVFGWLFRINSAKVKPEAKDAVLKYQLECYNALYDHFTELDEYLKYRTELAENVWDQVEEARDGFKLAKNRLENLKREFSEARALSLADYKQVKAQLAINFEEGGAS